MPLPPPRDHRIDLPDAARLTSAFQKKFPDQPKASLFPLHVFLRLGAQAGAGAIRIYYGLDAEGMLTPVLAGVNGEGNDMLPGTARDDGEQYELFEFSYPCPIFCGDGNALNGG